MNTYYTIKNFRVFNQEGQTFKMSPITVLTGCNSSGKSSLVKSQLLLRDFIRKIQEGLDKGNCRPDLYHLEFFGNEMKFGAFNSVKNHDSEEGSKISFSYEVSVPEIGKPVLVTYEFVEDKNDIFRNGILSHIRISGLNGEVIYEAERTEDLSEMRPEIGIRLETKVLDLNYFLPLKIYDEHGKETAEIHRQELFELDIHKGLKDATKDNINSFFPNIFCEEKKEILYGIIDHFQKSNCSTFGQYVDCLSKDFLSIVEPWDDPLESGTKFYSFDKIFKRYLSEYMKMGFHADEDSRFRNKYWFSELLHLEREKNAKPDGQPSRDLIQINNNSLLDTFFDKCIDIIMKMLTPDFIRNMEYVGSSRATIARIYTLAEKTDDFSRILTNYAEEVSRYKSNVSENSTFSPGSFINKWAKRFEIGESIEFKYEEDGKGLSIIVHKDKTDIKGHLLADEGYGLTQLLSTLISIEILAMKAEPLGRMNDRYKDDVKRLWHGDQYLEMTGYDFYFGDYKPSTLAIEEPEIHLHPEYQSKLAEMFLDAYRRFSIEFIIETHSEYLIRRLQTMIPQVKRGHEYGLDLDELSIYYINSPKRVKEDPQLKQVVRIKVGEDGRLQNSFGPGFFDEATRQALKLVYPEM